MKLVFLLLFVMVTVRGHDCGEEPPIEKSNARFECKDRQWNVYPISGNTIYAKEGTLKRTMHVYGNLNFSFSDVNQSFKMLRQRRLYVHGNLTAFCGSVYVERPYLFKYGPTNDLNIHNSYPINLYYIIVDEIVDWRCGYLGIYHPHYFNHPKWMIYIWAHQKILMSTPFFRCKKCELIQGQSHTYQIEVSNVTDSDLNCVKNCTGESFIYQLYRTSKENNVNFDAGEIIAIVFSLLLLLCSSAVLCIMCCVCCNLLLVPIVYEIFRHTNCSFVHDGSQTAYASEDFLPSGANVYSTDASL
jgi:hypothetical protein